jgi:signal transduction histidine kinase
MLQHALGNLLIGFSLTTARRQWPTFNIRKYIREADVRSGGKLRHVAQLMKHWRECRSPRVPLSSFHIEMLLVSARNCMTSFNNLRIQLRFWLCVCVVIATFAVSPAESHSNLEVLPLADLQRLVSERGRAIQSFRLAGVVCAVVPQRRLVALQDESATTLLELPMVTAELQVGDWLAIEGTNCSLIRGDVSIQISAAPVVDNDGHHPALLQSGKVYLPTGFQPIQLAWYNRIADAVLKLEWEGPGLRRQKVSEAVLWRKVSGSTNSGGWEQGLDYAARNGDGTFLADFENQEIVGQGVATNFDVSYRVRPDHTALNFSGYLEVPQAGIYTFYLTSDDGAQLRVGESSVSMTRLSKDHAEVLKTRTLNQARAERGNSSWVELEGEVAFVGVNMNHLKMELVVNGDRIPVTVVGGAALLATNLLHDHVRVRGICEFSLEDEKMARVVVPSLKQVEILESGNKVADVSSTNLLLTSVAQIKQLSSDQVARKIPARIRGVLVGVRDIALMVQDSTGGISVRFRALDWTHQPRVGEMLEVEGVTGQGAFAPVITAKTVRRLGNGPMPEPIRPRWDQLMSGSLDCVYVEVQGILTAASEQELTLLSADGKVTVLVDGSGTDNLHSLLPGFASNDTSIVGSLVRLRGCCMPDTDQQARQVIRGRIRLNTPLITVEELAPSDPFSLSTKKIADLLWFDPRASALQRTKLKGQVLYAQSGEYLALEAQRGFRILTSQPADLHAGDLIEAVGFPKLDSPSPVLQEAQILKTGQAPLPVPVPVSAEELLDDKHDSTLIQVEATLIAETVRSQGHVLEMQAGARHFLAVQKSGLDSTPSLAAGSRLKLVGVYASASANLVEASTDPFSLLLIDGAGAIEVLERPSWWTAKHALILAAILAGILGLAFIWITLLRQKVEVRTAQLRKEISERQRVEQAQAIEQERTRVAQDLHDELGSGLTTMGLLGALVNNPATPSEKKTGYLEQITHSAHSLVTALDEIVWAVNPQHDSIASSASYYAYFAQPFLNAAGIACRLEIADQFAEHPLDPHLRHGVFLAFKEALNNVVRHSGATEVTIKILTASEQLIIAIHDNGQGLNPNASQSEPGHDGLAGMRDRLAHFGGTFLLTSQAGLGTTVEFRIPLPQPRSDNADGSAEA